MQFTDISFVLFTALLLLIYYIAPKRTQWILLLCSREQWDQQIEEYAAEKGLLYINMLDVLEEIGIDWTTDTYDAGLHLNVYGAEKASRWFGQILSEECGVPDRRNETQISAQWVEKCTTYHARKTALETERDS